MGGGGVPWMHYVQELRCPGLGGREEGLESLFVSWGGVRGGEVVRCIFAKGEVSFLKRCTGC